MFVASGKLSPDAPGWKGENQRSTQEKRAGHRPTSASCRVGRRRGSMHGGGPVQLFAGARNRRTPGRNAISADGTRVFWTDADGSLYLRENPFGSGSECSGAGNALHA